MRALIFLSLVVMVGVAGFFVFNNFIYNQKQDSGVSVVSYEATLTGEYVCLQPKDSSGAQTLECAYGLKTQTGEYFALDFGDGQGSSEFVTGEVVSLTGTVTPIERLSTDYWHKYDIQGILSVVINQEIELSIKNQLVAKHGSSVDALEIRVTKLEGDYAMGSAAKVGMGGGMWFAAEVDGSWRLVWDGNGIISCADLENYPDFPNSMIPECFDPIGGEMVER